MISDSSKSRKQVRACEVVTICILSWLFAVVFAVLVSSCTKKQAAEPKPAATLPAASMRCMQMEAEDFMPVGGLQPANAEHKAETMTKTKIKKKDKAKAKHKPQAPGQSAPFQTVCDDFELTVSRGEWTLHITPIEAQSYSVN